MSWLHVAEFQFPLAKLYIIIFLNICEKMTTNNNNHQWGLELHFKKGTWQQVIPKVFQFSRRIPFHVRAITFSSTISCNLNLIPKFFPTPHLVIVLTERLWFTSENSCPLLPRASSRCGSQSTTLVHVLSHSRHISFSQQTLVHVREFTFSFISAGVKSCN